MEGVTSSILVAPTIEAPRETWGLRPFLGLAISRRVTESVTESSEGQPSPFHIVRVMMSVELRRPLNRMAEKTSDFP